MVGRRRELDAVTRTLNSANTFGVMVTAAAGVGRSRLIAEAVRRAAASGWAIREMRANPGGRSIALGAVSHWPGHALDETTSGAALRVISIVAAEAKATRVLVVVDDAHWLDEASAFVLHQLLQRGDAKALISTRARAVTPPAVLDLWKDGLLCRMDLEALTHRDVVSLLASQGAVDCVDDLADLARGNLVILEHLVAHQRTSGSLVQRDGGWQLASIPPALADLILLESGSPDSSVRDVVVVVAIGGSMDRVHVESVCDSAAVAEAERLELIAVDDGGDVVVADPLCAKVIVAQYGPLRLRHLRGRLATAMATAGADPVRVGALWVQSDLPADPEIVMEAATAALARLDVTGAEEFARALCAVENSDRAKLLHALSLALTGRVAPAGHIVASVDAESLHGPDYRRYGHIHGILSVSAAATSPLPGRQQNWVRPQDHQAGVFTALECVAQRNPSAVLEVVEAVCYENLDTFGRVTYLIARAWALTERGHFEECRDDLELAGLLLDSHPDALTACTAVALQTDLLVLAGYPADAQRLVDRFTETYSEMSDVTRALSRAFQGVVAAATGDLTTALRLLDPEQLRWSEFFAVPLLSRRFDVSRALAAARSGRPDAEAGHPIGDDPDDLIAQAWTAAARGRRRDAVALTNKAAGRARDQGRLATEVSCLQASVCLGSLSAHERLAELATRVDGRRCRVAERHAHALMSRDVIALEQISHEWENAGDILAALDAAAASATHREAGPGERALAVAARVARLSKLTGALVVADTVSPTVPSFTARQHSIARLILAGHSNREIADALRVSVRTVEGHIYRAGSKFGVTNRVDLATLIVQFEPGDAPMPSS